MRARHSSCWPHLNESHRYSLPPPASWRIVAELLNARWKVVRSGASAPSLDSVLGLIDRIHLAISLPYAADAAALAQRLDHPVSGCLYAVLAKRENAQLVTADRRFAAKLTNDVVNVVTV